MCISRGYCQVFFFPPGSEKRPCHAITARTNHFCASKIWPDSGMDRTEHNPKKVNHSAAATETILSDSTKNEGERKMEEWRRLMQQHLGPLLLVEVGGAGVEHHGLDGEVLGVLLPVALLHLALHLPVPCMHDAAPPKINPKPMSDRINPKPNPSGVGRRPQKPFPSRSPTTCSTRHYGEKQ